MKQTVYLLIGVPGTGKSWVAEQLKDKFMYVPHDKYKDNPTDDVRLLAIKAATLGKKPVLTELPFSISGTKNDLEENGFDVECVFIIEPEKVVKERYFKREGKEINKGNLTRQKTYLERAKEYGSFVGTSEEVLKYLKGV